MEFHWSHDHYANGKWISIAAGTGANVFGNTVTNISVGAAASTLNATVDGILVSGGTSINVFKNKIHGITTEHGNATIVSGIVCFGLALPITISTIDRNLTRPAPLD